MCARCILINYGTDSFKLLMRKADNGQMEHTLEIVFISCCCVDSLASYSPLKPLRRHVV